METGKQILKTRDDRSPVFLNKVTDDSQGDKLVLDEGSECSWWPAGENQIKPRELRKRIEPWLTSLLQSEHLNLLIGSGLTHALHQMAAPGEKLQGMQPYTFKHFQTEIKKAQKESAKSARRGVGNVEDQIRVANDLLRGLQILRPDDIETQALTDEIEQLLDNFAASILEGERNIASSPNRDMAFGYLVNFLMSFASRNGTRERLHIFTTNYDRLIEAGADEAGLRLIDRFVGSLSPVFRSSRLDVDMHYNPPGIRGEPRYLEGVARYTKLHGSLDWTYVDGSVLRFALPLGAPVITQYMQSPLMEPDSRKLMIYPNSSKDRETADYPYVELFRDFAAAACKPNSTLVSYGYSFGDEHINRVIADMLTIPSTHLVIISYGDPLGTIMRFYEEAHRPAQCTLLIGDHLADLRTLVEFYLPKPSIDLITLRMSRLLKERLPTATDDSSAHKDDTKEIWLEGEADEPNDL